MEGEIGGQHLAGKSQGSLGIYALSSPRGCGGGARAALVQVASRCMVSRGSCGICVSGPLVMGEDREPWFRGEIEGVPLWKLNVREIELLTESLQVLVCVKYHRTTPS